MTKVSDTGSKCEDCMYMDTDEFGFTYCRMELDEDESVRFARGDVGGCPYYKYYDEYTMVRKQN